MNFNANLKACGDAPQLSCLVNVVQVVINLALSFVGAACVIYLLWGAIKFIVSRGDPKAVQSAKATMTYAAIGAALILGAFIIVRLIANMFVVGGSTSLGI